MTATTASICGSHKAAQRKAVGSRCRRRIVKAVRDGVADVNGVRSVLRVWPDANAATASSSPMRRWETQFATSPRSVRLHDGERVEVGAPLGLVGLSGQPISPMHFRCATTGNGGPLCRLCAMAARVPSAVVRHGGSRARLPSPSVINFGFADERFRCRCRARSNERHLPTAGSRRSSPSFARWPQAATFNASPSRDPAARAAHSETPPLDRNMAERFMFVGKRKMAAEWPRGTMKPIRIRRDGATALSRPLLLRPQIRTLKTEVCHTRIVAWVACATKPGSR